MGLGNPGPRFQNTRHNVGFWFLDLWAGIRGLRFRKPWFRPYFLAEVRQGEDLLVLVKPLVFMNRSGVVLPGLLKRYRAGPGDFLVVFDQMDQEPGVLRCRPHGSSGGHNGLKSVEAALGTPAYGRLALGIGRPAPGTSVIDHVLGEPSPAEGETIRAAAGAAAAAADRTWNLRWELMQNAVNQSRPGRP